MVESDNKKAFVQEWVFITLISYQDCQVSINTKFEKGRKVKNLQSNNTQNEEFKIDMENFSLGPGNMHVKKHRIESYIGKLKDDGNEYEKFIQSQRKVLNQNDINFAKVSIIERNSEIAQNYKTYTQLR